ncbi:hypothetical protein W97_03146 [Coniosporium apollinis CBS 100218]|uniref:MIT domain-containing protein n=1 Tax=Coniosporium apollinis (strain CBS 100218) TaxID=1168221 RepID=R7YPZ2_CONA1|nr:uncharacterized protein W97_03146 [Coniosporium apollinis CBS 100218]EON63918.1 hypothetical protein W97_03146 [Coniosporium apollinis CBS 100218]
MDPVSMASPSSSSSSSAAANARPPSAHTRRSSRSGSQASSSGTTVKRAASLSSSNAPYSRFSSAPFPSFDSAEAFGDAATLPARNTTPTHRRRSSVAEGFSGIKEGIGNLNRWSHSTTSSRSSTKDTTAGSSFSRRMSISGSTTLSSVHGSSAAHSSPSRKSSTEPRYSPTRSPHRRARPPSPLPSAPPITLPPLSTPPTHFPQTSYESGSTSTPATAGTSSASEFHTPLSHSNSTPDYFGSRIPKPGSPKRSMIYRSTQLRSPHTTPPILLSDSSSRPSGLLRAGIGSALVGQEPGLRQRLASNSIQERRDEGGGSGNPSARLRERSTSDSDRNRESQSTASPPRTRERREKDKKSMLSRALQKANTAVLLDNALNFEGAVEAYEDACRLLQQVMLRSSGEDDRRKLDSIRITYTNRIQELQILNPSHQPASGKSLPARPMSDESLGSGALSLPLGSDDDDEPVVIGTASTMPITSQSNGLLKVTASNSRLSQRVPAMRLSAFDSPMDKSYMPPPLSPRPPPSPSLESGDEPAEGPIARQNSQVSQQGPSDPEPIKNDEPVSWLDTIDESDGSSCASSVHSVSSLDGAIHRKHLRNNSGSTQAEFDAALDAAVEAAYDDGFEPYEEDRPLEMHQSVLSKAPSAMDRLANERDAELAREDLIKAAKLHPEADEEERMLDEMTKEYMLEGFDFDLQSKSALPRQSDSSGFSSGSAWNSSMSSNRTTAGTSLSTVAELPAAHLSTIAQLDLPLPAPPPTISLPAVSASHPEEIPHQPPISTMPSVPSVVAPHGIGVRSRRLSGKDPKHLKIETSILVPHVVQPPLSQDRLSTTAAQGKERKVPPALESLPKMPASAASLDITPPTPLPGSSPADSIPIILSDNPDTALTRVTSEDSTLAPKSPRHFKPSTTKSSHPPTSLRKNGSSLSLKSRALSLSSPDGSENSIHTPLSTTFAAFSTRKLSNPAIAPTPTIPTFATDSLAIGGLHLFNSDIQSPSSTDSATQLDSDTDGPIPLEPCPDAHLLRPFWLLRAVYQTLAHPRGGYLSNKLFVPRNIWTVNGVKLKHVDEKIANMDLLTAALLRLARVDEDDAEAVLEEMQALEKVLDQAQAALARKLGSEVGVNGIGSFFKDATGVVRPATGGSEAGLLGEQKVGAQAKSYLTSWRKLRSKGSAMGLNAHGAGTGAVKDLPKDAFTMPSLPMTGLPAIRFAKRDVKAVTCEGPNANYMGSLVRLCDAVQILDQIARQAEDPGLRHSSQTHVGLELSTRHAAEFFGFYVCRFVLQDVGILLDKFVKRGCEWVLV